MARVRPGEEHLHATDGGGVSNAGAIGVRRLCAARPTRREVPLKRVEVGQVELRCNPDSQAAPPGWTPCARLPWLTGARKRTQCGRTVSQQARQGWHGRRRCSLGETYSFTAEGRSPSTLAALAACKLRQRHRKELITDHLGYKEKTKRTARCTVALRRKHQLQVVVRNVPGLQAQACVCCVQAGGPEPRPDPT